MADSRKSLRADYTVQFKKPLLTIKEDEAKNEASSEITRRTSRKVYQHTKKVSNTIFFFSGSRDLFFIGEQNNEAKNREYTDGGVKLCGSLSQPSQR